jgi:hypothetical protein
VAAEIGAALQYELHAVAMTAALFYFENFQQRLSKPRVLPSVCLHGLHNTDMRLSMPKR